MFRPVLLLTGRSSFRHWSFNRRVASKSTDSVQTNAKGNLFFIRINRPEKRNCVNKQTAELLRAAFTEFDERDDVAVAVLSGVGGNFCSGYDLSELSENGSGEMAVTPAPMGPSHMATRKPVIAAVDGYAVAGGLELALLCDLRVVEENAVLGVYCRRFGVPLIDGGTVRLPAIIGLGRALDMILTGRSVSGKEAHAIGLATQVVAVGTVLGQATNLAQSIAKFPSKCLEADRRSVFYSCFRAQSLDDALKFEFENGSPVVSEEGVVGAKRFMKGMGRQGKSNLRAWDDLMKNNVTETGLLDPTTPQIKSD